MRVKAEIVEQWLSECEDHIGKLNDKEQGYIESYRDQFDRRGFLSEAQLDTLENIYTYKVP